MSVISIYKDHINISRYNLVLIHSGTHKHKNKNDSNFDAKNSDVVYESLCVCFLGILLRLIAIVTPMKQVVTTDTFQPR